MIADSIEVRVLRLDFLEILKSPRRVAGVGFAPREVTAGAPLQVDLFLNRQAAEKASGGICSDPAAHSKSLNSW
jgi:hypothetical protein